MTTELYNKGLGYAVKLMKGLRFPFTEYDVVHDVIAEGECENEEEFLLKIKSSFWKENRAVTNFININTGVGEKKEETIGDCIDEEGHLHLSKHSRVMDWRVCTKCHEPKPIGAFYVGMQYNRGQRFIGSACNECLHKQAKDGYTKRRETLAESYIVSLIKRRDKDCGEITHDDIEIKRAQVVLNRLSTVLGNGIYTKAPTYKYKRK